MWNLLKQTVAEWLSDDAPQLGAALAFYAAFSMAPLLVIALRVAAFFFGPKAAQGELERQLDFLLGARGGRALQDVIANADQPIAGGLATTVSVIVLVFGASAVFGQLHYSFRKIWKSPETDRLWWLSLIRNRLFSFAMVVAIAALLLISTVLSTALTTMESVVGPLPEHWAWVNRGPHFAASVLLVTLLFALMFKVLPEVKVRWRDVWLGALVTSLLFTAGKSAIGWYLGRSSIESSYGLAGSFVALLAWIYYSAQILFFGAELTQVYAKRHNSPPVRDPQL